MEKIVLGLSGGLASGKSYLASKLDAYLTSKHIPVKRIELDSIRRYILWESMASEHVRLRKELADSFHLTLENTFLNRQRFTNLIFISSGNLDQYRQIVKPVFKSEVVKSINPDSFNIFEWTYIEEEGYKDVLTLPLVHLNVDNLTRYKRIESMGDITPGLFDRIARERFLPKSIVVESDIEPVEFMQKISQYDINTYQILLSIGAVE